MLFLRHDAVSWVIGILDRLHKILISLVDVFAGLNVLILLFKLHAQAQPDSYPTPPDDAPAPAIIFHPCGTPNTETWDEDRLLSIIHYADSLGGATFTLTVGPHLNRTYLDRANLYSTNLDRAILLNTQLGSAQNLALSQFEGKFPPLLCGTTLPADLDLAPNRDCGQLPQVLADRYPGTFESVEAAAEFVRQQVPSAEG